MADIHIKINQIMQKLPAIGKGQVNKQQGFKYRGIDDVMNALSPLLGEFGVFLVPEVLDTTRTERTTKSGGNIAFTVATVKYTFFAASDGSSLSAITVGEGMDSADKSTNKAMAAAMKYALFQTFCIPTEEMQKDDPDRETVEPSQPKEQNPAGTQVSDTAVNPPMCSECGLQITPRRGRTAQQMAHASKEKFGRVLCVTCARRVHRELDAIAAEAKHDDAGDRV